MKATAPVEFPAAAGRRTPGLPAPPFASGHFPHDPGRAPAIAPGGEAPPKQAVLIIHGSPVMRIGLAALVRSSPSFTTCRDAQDAPSARDLFVRHHPGLVILGLTLPHGDGIELLKDFRKQNAAVACLVLTTREDPLSLQRAFRAGARGYVFACDDAEEVLRGLAAIAAGELYASPAASRQLLAAVANGSTAPGPATVAGLSDRELQIFRLIGSGFGPTRVAAELRVSVKTVESHRTRIKEKLGLASGAELNARAARWLLDTLRHARGPAARNRLGGRGEVRP